MRIEQPRAGVLTLTAKEPEVVHLVAAARLAARSLGQPELDAVLAAFDRAAQHPGRPSESLPAAVRGLLDAVRLGSCDDLAAHYTDEAVLDATLPDWHFQVAGGPAIAENFAGWYADPAGFVELDTTPTSHGVLVTFELRWLEGGEHWGARQIHDLYLDAAGRISRHRVWCGGRWNAATLDAIDRDAPFVESRREVPHAYA